jgi:hypothetical protein
MKINRAVLERIIDEELVRFLERQITEAPQLGTVFDDVPPEGPDLPGGPPMEADGETVGDVDPMDAELDAEFAGEDPEVPGSVAGDIQGKTVSSIEHHDESESIPGAQEVVVSFDDTEDKLRIIVTPSGNVKYFWKGLHNDIGQAGDVPPEEIENEESIESEEDLDTEALPLPTDAGMEDPENPEV